MRHLPAIVACNDGSCVATVRRTKLAAGPADDAIYLGDVQVQGRRGLTSGLSSCNLLKNKQLLIVKNITEYLAHIPPQSETTSRPKDNLIQS